MSVEAAYGWGRRGENPTEPGQRGSSRGPVAEPGGDMHGVWRWGQVQAGRPWGRRKEIRYRERERERVN